MHHILAISCIWTKMRSQPKSLESPTSMLWMAVVGWSLDLLQYLKRTLCLSTNIYFGRCSFQTFFRSKHVLKINLSDLNYFQFYDPISQKLKTIQNYSSPYHWIVPSPSASGRYTFINFTSLCIKPKIIIRFPKSKPNIKKTSSGSLAVLHK